jgi:hypothetical protein
LAAFHGYTLRPSVQVDKVAADLTTIQADIRLIEPAEAPTDNAKLVTLTELLLRSNNRYESTVLMIRSASSMPYGQAVVMLKQAEERIQATSRSPRTETVYYARDRASMAQDRSVRTDMSNTSRRGRGGFGGRRTGDNRSYGKPTGDNRSYGKPTGGNRECWHCGSQSHIRTACPAWLNTQEGTKWAAKNPAKQRWKQATTPGPTEGAWTAGITINPQTWLVDSGATSHMTWNRDLFTTFLVIEPPIQVTIANGTSIPCRGVGSVELRQENPLVPDVITLKNVRYMPDLNTNLLSVTKLEDRGIYVASRPGFLDLIRDSKTLATAQRNGGSYVLELGNRNHQKETAFTAEDNVLTWELLHARLAHVGDHFITPLPKITEGIPKLPKLPERPRKACDPCARSKQIRIISREKPVPSKAPLGRLYIDGWGPYSVPALGYEGAEYYFSITCEATHKKWVIIVRKRAMFPTEFMKFKAYNELQSGFKIMAVRLDGAGENRTLGEELSMLGIAVEYTTAYTPSQNGVAERLNRTLVGMAKAMLLASGLPQKFWGFAIEAACYIRNRLPIGPGKITPEEAFTGKKPDIKHLRVFGCLAYVLKPHEQRIKLDPNSSRTAFVGYEESTRQYRVYDPVRNLVVRSHNIDWYENERLDFDWNEQINGYLTAYRNDDGDSDSDAVTLVLTPPETPFLQATLPAQMEVGDIDNLRALEEPVGDLVKSLWHPPPPVREGDSRPEMDQPNVPDESGIEEAAVPEVEPPNSGQQTPNSGQQTPAPPEIAVSGRPVRDRKPVNRLIETIGLPPSAKSALERPNIPATYEDAIHDPVYSMEWKAAIQDELQKLVSMGAFKVRDLPKGRKRISSRWVFNVKYTSTGLIDKFKARLVAKGFRQTYGDDYTDTFSPTIKMDSLRALLAIAAANNWPIEQMDIISAYLAGVLDEDIYMAAPDGLGLPDSATVKVIKALYGLKQSGRVWYKKIQALLKTLGFERTDSDWSVFVNKDKTLFVGVYVDDLVITGPSLTAIKALKVAISAAFPVKDLGNIKMCLGLHIVRDEVSKTLSIDQTQYIKNMLVAYRMENSTPVSTPIDGYESTAPALPGEPRADSQLYQQAVGSLQYSSVGTRLDITYAVGRLSQHLIDPTIRHWNAVLRVFRYLKGTLYYCLVFRIGVSDGILEGYTDADYASAQDRVSISAYTFIFNGASIAWSSKRQRTIATSTVEAEYIALCAGAKQAVWLRGLFLELGQAKFLSKAPGRPVLLYGDNQGALALVENPENHARTKHIDVQYHYIRHLVGNGSITTAYCPTDQMAADVLTKPLTKVKLLRCLETTFGH